MFCITNRMRGVLIVGLAALMLSSAIVRAADCNNNGVEDAQDITAGTSLDCQPDGVPDECQLSTAFSTTSGQLSPIGASSPQSYTILSPPQADGPVTITIRAHADLSCGYYSCDSFTVEINGAAVGSVFGDSGGTYCPVVPNVGALVVPVETFNSAAAGGVVVIRLVPSSGVSAAACSPSYAIIEAAYSVIGDCNANLAPDECDVAQGAQDCDGDGVLSECETDCNANAVPDDCDIVNGEPDTNGNGVIDECDLAILPGNEVCSGGANNGLACSNHADCPGGQCYTRNRFFPVTATSNGVGASLSSIQVRVVDVPSNLPSQQALMEGDVWWAGAPFIAPEGPPGGSFKTAQLECTDTPHFRDWSAEGLIHLHGPAVIPGTTYEVRACSPSMICSAPLVVSTAKYGDVIQPLGAGQPNFGDMATMVDKFQGETGAISKTRAKLQSNTLNVFSYVSFLDISENVSAFRGYPYPYPGASCP